VLDPKDPLRDRQVIVIRQDEVVGTNPENDPTRIKGIDKVESVDHTLSRIPGNPEVNGTCNDVFRISDKGVADKNDPFLADFHVFECLNVLVVLSLEKGLDQAKPRIVHDVSALISKRRSRSSAAFSKSSRFAASFISASIL